MAIPVVFEDLGMIDYMEAWNYQEKTHDALKNAKLNRRPENVLQKILFCEHPHVYTLGRSGHEENLLIRENLLKSIGATYYRIDRGGDITYHGPGQIVGYPIVDLDIIGKGVKSYIFLLEEAIIGTLGDFGIQASRLQGATGVWLDVNNPGKSRKICAIGVRVSRSVTMHGFALNVCSDLNYFSYINPCGFQDRGVTSMKKELGKNPGMNAVKEVLKNNLFRVFDFEEEGKISSR